MKLTISIHRCLWAEGDGGRSTRRETCAGTPGGQGGGGHLAQAENLARSTLRLRLEATDSLLELQSRGPPSAVSTSR